MRNIAVILAAGVGSRAGAGEPKQFRLLPNGKTLIQTCVEAFAPFVCRICVVTHPDFAERTRNLLSDSNILVVNGGKERWESSWNAIRALAPLADDDTNLLIHDCARPFVAPRIINDVCLALQSHPAVTVAVPATDTLYIVAPQSYSMPDARDNLPLVNQIPPRETFMRAQTPQAFRFRLIKQAYELALRDPDGVAVTDDCGIVKHYMPDQPIVIVKGDETNKKLTFPSDFPCPNHTITIQ